MRTQASMAQDRAWGNLHTQGLDICMCYLIMARMLALGTSLAVPLPVCRLRGFAARVCRVRARRLRVGALRGAVRGAAGGHQPAPGRRRCVPAHLMLDVPRISVRYVQSLLGNIVMLRGRTQAESHRRVSLVADSVPLCLLCRPQVGLRAAKQVLRGVHAQLGQAQEARWCSMCCARRPVRCVAA